MYHVPLVLQRIYRRIDERGENRDGKDGSEILGEGERLKIAWPFVCK